MPLIPLKSDAEHLKFLKSFSALKVRFALDWAAGHPGTGFAAALADRTFFVSLGIWHKGGIFDAPKVEGKDKAAWEDFLNRAEPLAGRPDAEKAILGLLPPEDLYFTPRVVRDQVWLHHPTEGLAALKGCLWVTPEPQKMRFPDEAGAPKTLEFHIANHKYPGSFLQDPQGVRNEVRQLALKARDLGFEAVGTRTWLNGHPLWLGCFPPVWTERLTPPDYENVGGHLGVWGQVVTARQTLSPRADRYIRAHGRFEYYMRASWLTVEEALG